MTAALPARLYRRPANQATGLDATRVSRFEHNMSASPPTKAEIAAAKRAASRAALEAAALRANLHRRKQQDRARKAKPAAPPEGAKECR